MEEPPTEHTCLFVSCALQASIRRQAAPPPDWKDPDEVVEWVTALMDDALEGVDSALDAFKRGDEAVEGAAGSPAGQRQGACCMQASTCTLLSRPPRGLGLICRWRWMVEHRLDRPPPAAPVACGDCRMMSQFRRGSFLVI